jgi:dethiobiotin synthetase
MQRIGQEYVDICSQHDLTVVEGAGGIGAPLNRRGVTMGDLVNQLGLPALLVCSPGLGTLNHSFLSHAYMQKNGVHSLGFAMCHMAREIPEIFSDNVNTIREFTGMAYWGAVGFCEEIQKGTPLGNKQTTAFLSGISEGISRWWQGV